MSSQSYDRPFKTAEQLLEHLVSKGLTIQDQNKAIQFLSSVNYYRFKIYLRPLRTSNKQYLGNFEDAVSLYRFDEELRNLLLALISRIEIKLRSLLDQMMCSKTNNPYWYLDDTLFLKDSKIHDMRNSMRRDFNSSKESFSSSFRSNYHNTFCPSQSTMPPFWIISEVSSFGQIMNLYKSLNKASINEFPYNPLDKLAMKFGADNLAQLNKWISVIRALRNKSAHHSRVFNANFQAPSTPRWFSPTYSTALATNSNRLYSGLVMLEIIRKNLQLDFRLKAKLQTLFETHPASSLHLSAMGVPQNWDKSSFWNTLL